MGVMKQLKEEQRRKGVGPKKSASSSYHNFVSFHPTKEQREQIKEQSYELEGILDFLSTWLNDGFKLTIQYNEAQEAYCVMLRDGKSEWQSARVLSCWHVDWARALQTLVFALETVYTHFPDIPEGAKKEELDW